MKEISRSPCIIIKKPKKEEKEIIENFCSQAGMQHLYITYKNERDNTLNNMNYVRNVFRKIFSSFGHMNMLVIIVKNEEEMKQNNFANLIRNIKESGFNVIKILDDSYTFKQYIEGIFSDTNKATETLKLDNTVELKIPKPSIEQESSHIISGVISVLEDESTKYGRQININNKLKIVGPSLDQLVECSTRGIIPDLYEMKERQNLDKIPRIKEKPKDDEVIADGYNKLSVLFSYALNYAVNNSISDIVYVGSAPGQYMSERIINKIKDNYNITIKLIDPRESELNRKGITDYFWQEDSKKHLKDEKGELIIDDSYLEYCKEEQVDVKMQWYKKYIKFSTLILKVKPSWTRIFPYSEEMDVIFLPFVRREYRILLKPTYKITSNEKEWTSIDEKFNYYQKQNIGWQKWYTLGQYTMKRKEFTRLDVNKEDVISATYTLGSMTITKLLALMKDVESKDAFIINTQPIIENDFSKKYGDTVKKINDFLKHNMYILSTNKVIGYSKFNAPLNREEEVRNIIICSRPRTDEMMVILFSNPLLVKLNANWRRKERQGIFDYKSRTKALVESGTFALLENNKLMTTTTQTIMGTKYTEGCEYEISGHLYNLFLNTSEYNEIPLYTSWLEMEKMILNKESEEREKMFEQLALSYDNFETKIGDKKTLHHTEKEIKLTLHLLRLKSEKERNNNIVRLLDNIVADWNKTPFTE
jgi:hypothetical protein